MPRQAQAGPRDYVVAAVEHALDVVAALVRTGPATLSEVAMEAACTRVTAFRALHTLQARGLVMQDGPRGRWRLGAAWLSVTRAAEEQRALAHAAEPHLRALATMTEEMVQLSVRDGQEGQVAAVERNDPERRAATPVGSRFPLHAGPGRLLLAYAPEALQRCVLTSRLARLTSSTRIDPAWIAADLPRICARGWLIATNEVQDGVVTISAGVQDNAGVVAAVLTIQAPGIRMRVPRPQSLLTPLIEAAAAVGKAISAFSAR